MDISLRLHQLQVLHIFPIRPKNKHMTAFAFLLLCCVKCHQNHFSCISILKLLVQLTFVYFTVINFFMRMLVFKEGDAIDM